MLQWTLLHTFPCFLFKSFFRVDRMQFYFFSMPKGSSKWLCHFKFHPATTVWFFHIAISTSCYQTLILTNHLDVKYCLNISICVYLTTVNFHYYVAVTASKSPGLIITMVYSLYVFHALSGLAVALLLYLLEFWTKSQGVSATWDVLFSQ